MKHPRSPLPPGLAREIERTARDPADATKWAVRMLEAQEAGDPKAVHRAAARVKRAAPRATSIRRALGLAAFQLGEWHEASQELLAYRRLTGDRRVDAEIGECYRRLGRPGRALEFLADLRRDDVGDRAWVDAQVTRARSLADSGRRDVAISVLESLRVDPRKAGEAVLRAHEALRELKTP